MTLGSLASGSQFPFLRNGIISILRGCLKGQVRYILKSAQSDKSKIPMNVSSLSLKAMGADNWDNDCES